MNCRSQTGTKEAIAFLGIDVAKVTFEAALVEPMSGKVRRKRFVNQPAGFQRLSAWLSELAAPSIHACLEATGTYSEDLAQFLHQAGFRVSVVNPARVKAFAQSCLSRNKTDKADAALIARFCYSQRPEAWVPTDPALGELQALTRHLEALLAARQQQANRLEGERSDAVRHSLQSLIGYLEAEIEEIKHKIQEHINQHPALKEQQDLLCSIPGIGTATAAKLLAEVRQMSSYSSARQAAAYAGLTPRQHQSGSSVRAPARLCKTGNGRVRKALYLPAVVAMRYNPVIRALAQRLRERGKPPMVIVGAAMRKLLHLAYGVLKTRCPFDPNYALHL